MRWTDPNFFSSAARRAVATAVPSSPRSDAAPASPLLDRRTTLKDALSMLLDADVQAGVVTDRTGRLRGIVTADMVADWFRSNGRTGAESESGARSDSRAASEP